MMFNILGLDKHIRLFVGTTSHKQHKQQGCFMNMTWGSSYSNLIQWTQQQSHISYDVQHIWFG